MVNAIIDTFDLWTTAQNLKTSNRGLSASNQSLLGIKKLRELILELALQGKLTQSFRESNPELILGSNSAKTLIEKINAERIKNFKEGKIKKPEFSHVVGENEKLFELPKEWEWVRLQQIIQISSGDGLVASNMDSNGAVPVFGGNGINGYHNKGNITKPTLVIGRVGFYCGSIHITPKFAWVTDNAFITTFSEDNIDINFLYWLLRGTNLKENENATAQPVISGRKVYPIVVGFPPLAEQHRIVSKVDELMALCDQLEQQQTNTNEAHQTLVDTLLGSLTNAENPAAFEEAWQRIANHFDTLLTTEHSIEQLKQTILQLAVMGKLVPQNPDDEPASELLKRIAKEKVRLVKEGEIKKQAPPSEITRQEKPFELPDGWEFIRLEEISSLITKGSSPKWQGVSYTENPADILFVTSENVGSYEMILEDKKFVEMKFNEIEPRSILKKGDYLMNIVGGSIGRTAIYNIDSLANINQAVCLIRILPAWLERNFLLHFFNSSICVSYMFDKQVDNARANLSMGNISKFVMPVPPPAEQHRIVSKIEELFALCDVLKERIRDAQALQNQLAVAVVGQAV